MDKVSDYAVLIERGVSSILADSLVRNVRVEVDRDATIRASVIRMMQTLADATVWTERRGRRLVEPGLLNGLRHLIPGLKPRYFEIVEVLEVHNNCPHLPWDQMDRHLDWLSHRKMRWSE